jgi:hypothetical protein
MWLTLYLTVGYGDTSRISVVSDRSTDAVADTDSDAGTDTDTDADRETDTETGLCIASWV